jgi:excisionase family DNA binding protein
VQRALARADDNGAPWLTTEQAAELLGTSRNAIHQKLAGGWMAGHRIREGKRVLLERTALLAELERKKRRS